MSKKKNKTQNDQDVSSENIEEIVDAVETKDSSVVIDEPKTELVEVALDETPTEQTNNAEKTQDSVKAEEAKPEAAKPQPVAEKVEIVSAEPKIEAPATKKTKNKESKTAETLEDIAAAIAGCDPNLTSSKVSISRGSETLLIKQSGGVHCFCRIVERGRNNNGQRWEAEFLANVPPQVHSKLVNTLKEIGIQDSKRQFFNPSGIL